MNYYDEIEQNVQDRMTKIKKETEDELKSQRDKQDVQKMKSDYTEQTKRKFLQSRKDYQLNTHLSSGNHNKVTPLPNYSIELPSDSPPPAAHPPQDPTLFLNHQAF